MDRISAMGRAGELALSSGEAAIFDIKPASLPLEAEETRQAPADTRSLRGPRGFVAPQPRSTYQPSSRASGPAAIGSLLMVGGLISALLYMNVGVAPRKAEKLLMISLATTPPPPPHQQRVQPRVEPTPVHPQIVVPPPVVTMRAPPATIATTPIAVPAVVVPPPVAPAGPPAPVSAPAPAVADGGDLSSRMVSAKPPSYPLESRRRHEQGTVVLSLILSTDGSVSTISVAESSGSDRLDQAALAAVRKWRWAPIVRNGAPVMVQGKVRIPFILTP